MKTNITRLTFFLIIITGISLKTMAIDIGYINVHWSTNQNCNPLYTADRWDVSLVILNYPSLTVLCPLQTFQFQNESSGYYPFYESCSCYDSQAQYLVIATVRLIRNNQVIGQGEYRSVMTCYDLYQLEDIYVTCSCD
jgi:hypothetical protein